MVTAKYIDLETLKQVDFYCQEKEALDLASGLCIFHDKDYLQDKANNDEYVQPSTLGRLDKNANSLLDISYVYRRFKESELNNVISEVEVLLNNTSFCFYKPDKSSRILRLEFPSHNTYDEKKFATLLAGIKNGSCKNALIKKPFTSLCLV